jgi:hypothetical protein
MLASLTFLESRHLAGDDEKSRIHFIKIARNSYLANIKIQGPAEIPDDFAKQL